MATFHYEALNAEQEVVEGEVQADSVGEAVAQLEADGLAVQSIRDVASVRAPEAGVPSSTKGTSASDTRRWETEQAVLRTHMNKVFEHSTKIAPALRAYADEMPQGRRRRQLNAVVQVLERGDVAEATAAMTTLPTYWIPLLSVAATSRDPGRVLHGFLEESQHADALRRQWSHILVYPLFVVGVAATVLTALSLFVIPIFREILLEFQLDLPSLTRFVLTLSQWINSGWILFPVALVLAVGALLASVKYWLPLSVRRWFAGRWSMPIGRTTAIARFAQFTADLLEAGLDIPDSLRIAGFTTNRLRLRMAAWRLAGELESNGDTGSQKYRHILTATVVHALQGQMQTASRVRLLKEVSCCHAERARSRLSWTRGIVEPLTIVAVGVLVGGIVIALFLPLVKLVEGLG